MPNSFIHTGRLLPQWLPEGKRAAVCLSVDDIHPGKSTDAYEAGGNLASGQLRHILWLLDRHPLLRVTLFTTADWRATAPAPTRKIPAYIPFIKDKFYLAPRLPIGTMRLGRHPEFVSFLRGLERVEIGLHGLHHVSRGRRVPVEFHDLGTHECQQVLQEMIAIFDEAGLPFVPGMTPPGWELSESLAEAMANSGLTFVASARDIKTPVTPAALTSMSGLSGVSLVYPEIIGGGKLLHLTSNFQATSSFDRACEIIEHGGLLSIKAHVIKNALGHIALDGLDELYRNYLDLIFNQLKHTYGQSLWWTSMGEIAERCMNGAKNH